MFKCVMRSRSQYSPLPMSEGCPWQEKWKSIDRITLISITLYIEFVAVRTCFSITMNYLYKKDKGLLIFSAKPRILRSQCS